jgi:hypothetical protein
MATIELADIDIRFEHCHLHDPKEEERLMVSLMKGIKRPLLCIKEGATSVLIDGFKRYRCADKLNISPVNVEFVAGSAADGFMELMCRSTEYKLTILEEARMISELKDLGDYTLNEIAQRVSRSRSWVSMRMHILSEMNDKVLAKIFKGSFPAYSWMTSVRPRMNSSKLGIDGAMEFIEHVSDKGHSHRDLDQLAWAYFEGSDGMREQIQGGKSDWLLKKLKETDHSSEESFLPFEKDFLKNLNISSSTMGKIARYASDERLSKKAFFAQAHIVTGGILGMVDIFKQEVEKLHDRCEHA